MHCLYGGYNLHRFSDALGLVSFADVVSETADMYIQSLVYIYM